MKKLFNTLSQQGKRKYFVEKGRKKDFSTRKTEKVFNTKLYCVKRIFLKYKQESNRRSSLFTLLFPQVLKRLWKSGWAVWKSFTVPKYPF